jgi:hypothetical protein
VLQDCTTVVEVESPLNGVAVVTHRIARRRVIGCGSMVVMIRQWKHVPLIELLGLYC